MDLVMFHSFISKLIIAMTLNLEMCINQGILQAFFINRM